MKKEIAEKKKSERIDVYNDYLMVFLGLRCPMLEPRDETVWVKTQEEKDLLKRLRKIKYSFGRWSAPEEIIPVPGKLRVQVRGFNKTTFVHECMQSDIPFILTKYKKSGDILNYTWNGKTYSSDSLPYWK